MSDIRQKGSTSNRIHILIRSKVSTPVGMGLTGLVFNTAGLSVCYDRDGSPPVAIALVTQTVGGAWVSGGFVEKDSVKEPGLYRLDVPDAAFVTGVNKVRVFWTGANSVDDGSEIDLTADDPYAAGLTTAQISDAVLARNAKGGSDGPANQSVAAAIAGGFMKVAIVAGVLTVEYPDGTVAFTRAITRAQADAIASSV